MKTDDLLPVRRREIATVSPPVRLEAVQQLTVETEAEGSVRLQWRQVPGVRGYRVVWGPFTGQRSSY